MITLSVEQLKDFQRRTQYIQRNTQLPSLSYIKLHTQNGKHYLTKNNLRCACVALVRGHTNLKEYEPLLIDDRILMNFINITKSLDITISFDENHIKLTDGKNDIKFQREDFKNFPATPSYGAAQTKFIFTKSHLDAIAIARNFLLDSESGGNFRFIHVSNSGISAFHTNYFYVNNQFSDLPTLRIDKEMADVITTVPELKFADNGNHYFFLATDMIYIFTQQEGNSPNLDNIYSRLKTPGKNFSCNKEDVIEFCDVANMVTESKMADCRIEPNGKALNFKLLDVSYNRNVDRHVDYEGDSPDEFNFDSKLLGAPLRAIPYDKLKGKTVQNTLIIEGNNEWFAFMALAPNVSK